MDVLALLMHAKIKAYRKLLINKHNKLGRSLLWSPALADAYVGAKHLYNLVPTFGKEYTGGQMTFGDNQKLILRTS